MIPYSVLAYFQLGTRDAPETYWQPSTPAVVVADLGQPRQLKQLDYFMSLGQGTYTVEFSSDGSDWHTPLVLTQKTQFEQMQLAQRSRSTSKPGMFESKPSGPVRC